MAHTASDRLTTRTSSRRGWLLQAVEILPVAAGLAFFVVFALVAGFRLQSPFPIGPFDVGFMQHVRRVLHHQSVYPAPTIRFVPLQYTPLYYYVSAAVARIVGEGFLPLRLVSIVSTLWSMAIIGAFVWRETGDRRSTVIAACLFSATYRAAGAWFDVPSTDMLRLALVLSAAYVLRFRSGLSSALLGAALMVLAALSKQSALVSGSATVLAVATLSRRRAAAFAGAFAIGVAISTVAMIRWEGDWYPFYVFRIATHQPSWDNVHEVFAFFSGELLGTVPIALLLPWVLLFGTRTGHDTPERALPAPFYLVSLMGSVAVATASKALQGSSVNATIPVYAWLSVIFGVMIYRLRLCVRSHVPRRVVIAGLTVAQFLMLAYVPASLVPRGPDPMKLVHLVGVTPTRMTPVRVADSGHLGTAYGPAVEDLLNGATPEVSAAFQKSVVDAMCEGPRMTPVVVDASIVRILEPHELPTCALVSSAIQR